MNFLIDWIKRKTLWLLTGLITVFGGITARLTTCTQQTTAIVAQVATNPSNQMAAVEAASFVANLFYEGHDDPFATPGMGGEIGKTISKFRIYRKGEPLFDVAIKKIFGKTEDIIVSSRRWKSSQIQEGARAIHKKLGHAEGEAYTSSFNGIKHTQQNAEKLIHEIVEETDVIIIWTNDTKMFTPSGRGICFKTKDAEFVGFMERFKETVLCSPKQ